MGKNGEKKAIRVAILGHRGIPNTYGGFETLAEELAVNLTGLGAAVSVYCRSNYFSQKPKEYKGVKLIYLSTVARKSLDTLFHTFVSVLHAFFFNTASVLIIVNVGNAPFALLARLLGKKVIFCVDGLDWQRKKWGTFARTYLRLCSYFANIASDMIVTDASSVYEFYKKERKMDSVFIPYGTEIETEEKQDEDILNEYHLEHKKYFTYVARFEPENNPLLVIKAHASSGTEFPLVMVGDNRYDPGFVEQLKMSAGKKVIFTGFQFGQRYKQLLKNSLCYVRAAEVGGHSPALIEAMGRGVCVIANDKSENREPLGDTGLFFSMDVPSLARQFEYASNNREEVVEKGKKSAQRAMVLYSWDRISFEYFKLIKSFIKKHSIENQSHEITSTDRKKKLMITGAGGSLGKEMIEVLSDKYIILPTTIIPTEVSHIKLDLSDYNEIDRLMENFKPDYVLHLAAITDLEMCEKNLPFSYSVNTLTTKNVAQLCSKYGATMIYTSTANVFNGEKECYVETDEPLPLNVYGLTKQMGEMMVQYYSQKFLILRLAWLVGGGVDNDKKFIGRLVQQIMAGHKTINAVDDKLGSISYAPDVAKTMSALLENSSEGIYHIASPGAVSRYEIAKLVVSILGYERDVKVNKVSSDFFSSSYSAPRPARECLVAERLKREHLDLTSPWQLAINDYLHKDFGYAFKVRPKIAITASSKPLLA
jgi:dTDP-4-dehydrorhamnose reductase